MIKNINNIFSILLMLTFIGCIYATLKDDCWAELRTGGFLKYVRGNGYINKDPSEIESIINTEWNGSIPAEHEDKTYMIDFVNFCSKYPNLKKPIEFCISYEEVGNPNLR
ncbi:uncharacterized protein LOC100573042 [Acyrthosiphon pisum]|uniref:Lipoprotein n=1 Tax=Acyrthosiphon pisum TaxID=7029 RepID=A0A8R1W8I2_ACYPI|nr:uncharacterized protein LOC100573042 [Acyrthosiphon pisum]|eukprot:XP_003243910.1 PREDICTED: uncharacterized protein LOC100573042 isoform X1 [Acyrthosiphon pisum]